MAENNDKPQDNDDLGSWDYYQFLLLVAVLGLFAGVVTVGFYATQDFGIDVLWKKLPDFLDDQGINIPGLTIIITTTGGILVGLLIKIYGDHGPKQFAVAMQEIQKDGRLSFKHLVSSTTVGLVSLFFGAALGPEAALSGLLGGIATWMAERLKMTKDRVQAFTFSAVSGFLSSFFGNPFGAALLALESPHTQNIRYYVTLIPTIISATTALVVIFAAESVLGSYNALPYDRLRVLDLIYAIPLGLLGALVGVIFGVTIMALNKGISRVTFLTKSPILKGAIGGFGLGLLGSWQILVLFSGEKQLGELTSDAATFGFWTLLLMALAKIAASGLCIATGFKGGLIFPLLFTGGVIGLAVNDVIPGLHESVAVGAVMTATIVVAMRIPIAAVIMLSVIFPTELLPVLTVASVVAFLVAYRLPDLQAGSDTDNEDPTDEPVGAT